MSVTDLIADQLTVIRNSIRARRKTVTIKRSVILEGIVGILKREGFIEDYQLIEDEQQGKIKVYLKWLKDDVSAMEELKRISTPGRRFYVSAGDVKSVRAGMGMAILSTNKGLLTDKEAREQNIGGEVVCQIW